MNPGSEPTTYGDTAWWLNQAALNYSSINPNNFEIVTNTGKLALTGQVQEFINGFSNTRYGGVSTSPVFSVPFAFADGSPANMAFTGVNGANDGHYYVSPYNGTMNGQNVRLFCVDIKNKVYFGETRTANVTNLGNALSAITTSAVRTGGAQSCSVRESACLASQSRAHA